MNKVLHITTWYPNNTNKFEGLFVKRHFDCISEFSNSDLIQLKGIPSKGLLSIRKEVISKSERSYQVKSFLFKYYRLEVFILTIVQFFLLSRRVRKYDSIIYHTVSPLAIKLKSLTRLLYRKKRIFIIEHHSGYKRNFGISEIKKLNIVRKVFSKNDFQLITVSQELQQNIIDFCGFDISHLQPVVVPNAIDTNIFNYQNENKDIDFTLIARWEDVKKPFEFLKALGSYKNLHPQFTAHVFGDGIYLDKMKSIAEEQGISENITFHGFEASENIAYHLKRTKYYVLTSEFETFSVSTAEALCCGCKVISKKINAIEEYINPQDWVVIEKDEAEYWLQKMSGLSTFQHTDHPSYHKKFSVSGISNQFREIIHE